VNASTVLHLADEAATARLAARLSQQARRRDVIALRGGLGTGKTSFARAFIRARGRGDEEVPSPTFTLVEIYDNPPHPAIWHFDLYRLVAPAEVYELGIEEAWGEGISLIEWPERIEALLPRDRLDLALVPGDGPGARIATLAAWSSWRERLAGFDRE
jgi:tRNA threonylcarbamoyladenosine biosynthesis protein TsaE